MRTDWARKNKNFLYATKVVPSLKVRTSSKKRSFFARALPFVTHYTFCPTYSYCRKSASLQLMVWIGGLVKEGFPFTLYKKQGVKPPRRGHLRKEGCKNKKNTEPELPLDMSSAPRLGSHLAQRGHLPRPYWRGRGARARGSGDFGCRFFQRPRVGQLPVACSTA